MPPYTPPSLGGGGGGVQDSQGNVAWVTLAQKNWATLAQSDPNVNVHGRGQSECNRPAK